MTFLVFLKPQHNYWTHPITSKVRLYLILLFYSWPRIKPPYFVFSNKAVFHEIHLRIVRGWLSQKPVLWRLV